MDEPLPRELESCSATRERGGANVTRLFRGTVENDAATVEKDAAAAAEVIIAAIIGAAMGSCGAICSVRVGEIVRTQHARRIARPAILLAFASRSRAPRQI